MPSTDIEQDLVNRIKRFKGAETQLHKPNLAGKRLENHEELEEGEIPQVKEEFDLIQTPLSSSVAEAIEQAMFDKEAEIKIKNEPVDEEQGTVMSGFDQENNIRTEPEEIFFEYLEPSMNIVKEEVMIDSESEPDHQPNKTQVQVPSENRVGSSVLQKQIKETKKMIRNSNIIRSNKCPLCPISFVKDLCFHVLTYHSEQLNGPNRSHTCVICENQVQRKDIYTHTATKECIERGVCRYCKLNCRDWKALQLHMLHQHAAPALDETCAGNPWFEKNNINIKQLPLFSCPLCLEEFEIEHLRHHFTTVHRRQTLQTCLRCYEQEKAKDMFYHSFSSSCKAKCECRHCKAIFKDCKMLQQHLCDEHPSVPSSGKLPYQPKVPTVIKVKIPKPPLKVKPPAQIRPLDEPKAATTLPGKPTKMLT